MKSIQSIRTNTLRVVATIMLALALAPALLAATSSVNLIPRPAKMTVRSGTFAITSNTVIFAKDGARPTAIYLAESLEPIVGRVLGVEAPADGAAPEGRVLLEINGAGRQLGEEGYWLTIEPGLVFLRAAQPTGLFYGCQTLRQLLTHRAAEDTAPAKLPCLEIEDQPRFPWRGLMLDPARYFLTPEFLRQYVDLAAFYKLNRLHLHLTDDLGWTIEIQRYPELTDMKRWPMTPATRNRGVYTQAELRALAAYAATRHVELVPEIEMPGHNAIPSWVFPNEVLCSNNPWRTRQKPYDENVTYQWTEPCVANPKTTEFYRNILREVIAVFPGPYVHLGGDEYFGLAWAQCPECRKLIETEGLRRGETEEVKRLFAHCSGNREKYLLYRHLMTGMCDFVRSRGRKPVLWDDLSWRGRFPEESVIMQWHYQGGHDAWQKIRTPENPAVEAARAGHDAVVAPYSHLYFDLGSTLEAVFGFNPMPAGLTAQQQSRILGPHAPVWNQRQNKTDAAVFPRMYALAEIGWSSEGPRDWLDFSSRVAVHEEHRFLVATVPAAHMLGSWSPQQMAAREKRVTIAWDATRFVRQAGEYEVILAYQSGRDGVYIDWVALLEDGQELFRDEHKGWSGATKMDHAYVLKIARIKPDAKYTLQAQLWIPNGGADSRGTVSIVRKQ